jgi:lipopolysaccharide export system permease protein
MAASRISNNKSAFDINYIEYSDKKSELRHYQLAWQQKFSLSFACFVLFMIGAPLGSIIRKGGIGTPLVFAVIFFVIFHLLNTIGEKW